MRKLVLGLLCGLTLVAGCDRGGEDGAQGADDLTRDLSGGKPVLSEDFSEEKLDPARWNNTAAEGVWELKDGWLHSPGARNKALWLRQPLPERVRVEFDVRSESPDGDIKVEIFGDGENHESGYILIFGGWKNSLNAIARLDEHGKDRLIGRREVSVEQGRVYKMAVVRTDGRVRWYLDRETKELLLEFKDDSPLVGGGHKHFAFNDWAVPLYFDNLKVYDLGK